MSENNIDEIEEGYKVINGEIPINENDTLKTQDDMETETIIQDDEKKPTKSSKQKLPKKEKLIKSIKDLAEIFQYELPSGSVLGGLTYNTTDLVAMSNPTSSTPSGTKVGTGGLTIVNNSQNIAAVYFSNTGGNNGLTIWQYAGSLHGSGNYSYGGSNLVITFDAILPMN